ncbi:MAG: glutathione synthase [Deltaproteobacteria bacterium]|nr:glutathione synthase [Deltaproteobacteria bacterium]
MRFVFVMDPVSTVLVDEDTSFALMLEAQKRGHRVDHCLVQDVAIQDGRPKATVRQATMKRDPAAPVTLGDAEEVDLHDVDAVFVRKDPPFDEPYHWLTLILEHLRGSTLVVNDPRGLRDANEKLYACHFPELMPRTRVDSDRNRIRAFVREVGGQGVIKPVDGHGGEGIFLLKDDDPNFNAHVETVTRGGRRVAMVQEYIPEVRKGDKRILLIGGEFIGAILRVPRQDDLRSNIHVGGSVVHSELDDADRKIIATMRERLAADGLHFVGLDVIGGKLTEVNVTSPTGIQQMTRLAGKDCEGQVITWVEEKVNDR